MFIDTISYSAAFLAGILSFISPCIVPLIPAYFTFITGFSLEELSRNDSIIRKRVVTSTAMFVTGFSIVFVLMGATASFFGGFFFKHKDILRIAGGFLIIILGIHVTGLFKINILDFEKRFQPAKRPVHTMGALIVGMAFGAGWSPCIGPLLGSILILAGNQETVREGMQLLAVYAAGLAIPFIGISLFINYLLVLIRKAGKSVKFIHATSGFLMIAVGILLVFDRMNLLNVSR
ncbi:MAG: cytochrome c biogenesis protein CcdA [Thermodesulfobacteriota bacterium]